MANLISRAPQPPDFHWCDSYYNTPFEVRENIIASDCLHVVEQLMPRGAQLRRYHNWQAIDQSDPIQYHAEPFVGKKWNFGKGHLSIVDCPSY